MNIVIPMAGMGSCFREAGFKTPKPLIDIQGRPMYQWATNSLPLEYTSRLIFVLREDAFSDQIIADIHATYGMFEPRIRVLENRTRGQAETVYLARDLMDLSQPTLIHHADTAFQSMDMPDDEVFGGLVVFESARNDARRSFARTHDEQPDRIIEVHDKNMNSCLASTGTYYFADTAWMLYVIKHALIHEQPEQGEFYIAPLYNHAIERGHHIQCLNCKHFTCLGTPEALENALPRMPLLINSQITQIAV